MAGAPLWIHHFTRVRSGSAACIERITASTGSGPVPSPEGLYVIEGARSADVVQQVGVDKRTGEPITRPGTRIEWKDAAGRSREFQPDPGWSYNPGRHALPPPIPSNARAAPGQPDWRSHGLPDMREMGGADAPEPLPRADSAAAAVAMVNDALGLTGRTNWRKVSTPVGRVQLRKGLTPHIVAKLDEHRERYANRIVPTLEAPDEVWMTWFDNGEYRLRYLKRWAERSGAVTVVTEAKDGSLLYNFIPSRAKTLNRQREGVLLHPTNEG